MPIISCLKAPGQWQGREPAEAALLNMATYELSGPRLSTMACLKFFPKIVNTGLKRCKTDDGFSR
jgi:hypothetical protein